MTEPKARPGAGQDSLLDESTTEQLRHVGRVEAAVSRSVAAARLAAVDEGAGALAIEAARAVDLASHRRDPYGVAAAARELREQLARVLLDPASRQGGPGADVEAFLAELAKAE